jgi:LPS sulfotransferase NodH
MMVEGGYERMSEWQLDDERFDQPPLAPGRTRSAYAICSTQRSGSWLLCRQLVNAGIGVPSEYFNAIHAAKLCARWQVDPRDTHAYLQALQARRTTANGVWGTKLQWMHYAERRTALKIALLGRSRLIYLYRDDVAAQAVSLHLSYLTGVWGFDGTVVSTPRTDIPRGDPTHLAICEHAIHSENRAWREFFASRRLEVMTLRYEDFVADQPGTVARIALGLGLSESSFRMAPPESRENEGSSEEASRRRELVERWREARARA